jgi:hypothetical protein
MEQCPSSEADQFSVSQEIPSIIKPEDSLAHAQVPATCLYPDPVQFSPYTHIPIPETPP